MEDLARHVEFVVAKTLGASEAELIEHFKDYLRCSDSFDGNQIARIRRQASVNVYGSPDDNYKYLLVLKDKLESDGHRMEFTAMTGANVRDIMLGVARGDHARACRAVLQKPVRQRTAEDIVTPVRWNDGTGDRWNTKHIDLLDSVSVAGKGYVDSVCVLFANTHATNDQTLGLYNVDACVGKCF